MNDKPSRLQPIAAQDSFTFNCSLVVDKIATACLRTRGMLYGAVVEMCWRKVKCTVLVLLFYNLGGKDINGSDSGFTNHGGKITMVYRVVQQD